MLYINSISNQKASIGRKFAICHEKIQGMPNILELTPSQELLEPHRSQKISFEEFEKRFKQQMREEYRKPQSRLKGLAKYSIENDVTLHSPKENSENSYRSILAEIINGIWRNMGFNQSLIDLTVSQEIEILEEEVEVTEEVEPETESLEFEDIAKECQFFSTKSSEDDRVSCILCQHYDGNIYACNKRNILLVDYHWEESEDKSNDAQATE